MSEPPFNLAIETGCHGGSYPSVLLCLFEDGADGHGCSAFRLFVQLLPLFLDLLAPRILAALGGPLIEQVEAFVVHRELVTQRHPDLDPCVVVAVRADVSQGVGGLLHGDTIKRAPEPHEVVQHLIPADGGRLLRLPVEFDVEDVGHGEGATGEVGLGDGVLKVGVLIREHGRTVHRLHGHLRFTGDEGQAEEAGNRGECLGVAGNRDAVSLDHDSHTGMLGRRGRGAINDVVVRRER